MHTDIKPHLSIAETWERLNIDVQTGRPVGLTAPSRFNGAWNDWHIPEDAQCRPNQDPFYRHPFDNKIHVWEYIKYYDADTYDWAMSEQPRLIYSHQFACSRASFDNLGEKLYQVASRLRLRDIGFWTPHMFERLIALYLVRYGTQPILTTAFWHFASSGIAGPGEQSLYGPRPLRYYKIMPKHCGLKK
jgi:hypothetical protein